MSDIDPFEKLRVSNKRKDKTIMTFTLSHPCNLQIADKYIGMTCKYLTYGGHKSTGIILKYDNTFYCSFPLVPFNLCSYIEIYEELE